MKTHWNTNTLRLFSEYLFSLFKDGKINCPLHLCGGNEAELLKVFEMINPEDYVFSTHRNYYHYLLKGGDKLKLLDEILGKESGVCKGHGRSMHIMDASINFYSSAIVAGMCAIACGVAYTFLGKPTHVWCFVGDGAEDSGHFIEAVRFAESWNLPITFVIEDNNYSIDTTKQARWKGYSAIKSSKILRYDYQRVYPHCGIGEYITI